MGKSWMRFFVVVIALIITSNCISQRSFFSTLSELIKETQKKIDLKKIYKDSANTISFDENNIKEERNDSLSNAFNTNKINNDSTFNYQK